MPDPANEMPSRKTLRPASTHRLPPLRSPRLLDQLRERIRYLHYSRSTEDVYVYWCRSFIWFHGLRHPRAAPGCGAVRSPSDALPAADAP